MQAARLDSDMADHLMFSIDDLEIVIFLRAKSVYRHFVGCCWLEVANVLAPIVTWVLSSAF